MFKNRGSPCYYLTMRSVDQKYYKNQTKVYIHDFAFYDVSHAKTDLHDKYII